MLKRKYMIVTVLAIIPVLFGSLLYANMTRAQTQARTESTYEYDPWADVNDDGVIDIFDLVIVASHYGSEGTPITKAGLLFDSGWMDITDKAEQYFNITHNLNSTDIIVDITGKKTIDSGVHQRNLGGTGYIPGWSHTYGGARDDEAFSMVQTSDGGYAIAGRTNSFGAGAIDFWLVKTGVESGLAWTDSTSDTITLYRGATDPYWNHVRVRIWKIKETP